MYLFGQNSIKLFLKSLYSNSFSRITIISMTLGTISQLRKDLHNLFNVIL